jgi:hypothetical protein
MRTRRGLFMRRGKQVWTVAIVAACLSAVGCDTRTTDPEASLGIVPSSSPVGESGVTYVALGDSWPNGAHCGFCRTFAGLYADGLEETTGRGIEFIDLTEATIPGTQQGQTANSLLSDLRSSEEVREAVSGADIVMVSTGLNELDQGALNEYLAGRCGGADEADCFREVGVGWHEAFDAILTEIEALRAGRATAIRLVSAENIFISDPELVDLLGEDFGPTTGALITKLLNDAMCDAATNHGAVCIDVRPILNGATLDQPMDENSAASHQAVADALVASGLEELALV